MSQLEDSGRIAITIVILAVLLLTGCITKPPLSLTPSTTIGPYPQPHGRIILLGIHRAQLLFSCRKTTLGGWCRFTHGASGGIMELRWQAQQIWQRSNNSSKDQQWQPITIQALRRLGLVVHPAVMMALLNGIVPPWLHATATNKWQGKLHRARIQIQWYPDQNRVDIINLSKGAKIRLLLTP